MEKFANIFKAYDVRGIYPVEINAPVARRVAEAFARILKPQKVVVGQDVRAHGEELKKAVIDGLLAAGVDVVDIGIITTDQLYFAVGQYGFDGGLSVTASHNPAEYNGLKFSEKSGAPIQSDNLTAMRDWALSSDELQATTPGKLSRQNVIDDYVDHVLGYIDTKSIKPLRIVANANFGAVGRGVDKIADKLHLELERLNWQEDGNFPKGPPNPLLPENRDETIALIKKTKPDFGVAWDADADRVFFFTGEGDFIPSTFIVALLSRQFLKRYPGSKIVHDITTSWVIDDSVKAAGGIPVTNRTGHTFMKARMRTEDAPFAGESSGHYYFRDSFYADNGIVPFLMLLEMVSKTGQSLKELVEPLTDSYKVSGEINFTVTDPVKAIEKVEKELGQEGQIDKTDGLVVNTDKWRLSVRPSNTEPLFRLNAEAHDQKTLGDLVQKVSSLINT
jgi:phosphomannomutase